MEELGARLVGNFSRVGNQKSFEFGIRGVVNQISWELQKSWDIEEVETMEELGTRSVGIFKRVEEFGTIKELGIKEE